ncbi:MAG: ATP-binding protein [Myxococcota bacterium]|jgi:signal transduction histidine kinase
MIETLHLMVVDDEVGMRLGVERALRNHVTHISEIDCDVSFRLSQAESGEAGLAIIEKDPPQILLLDYKLPGISGIDVLKHILDHKIDVMVVMITAYASLETAIQATKLGAYDFLAKPFRPDELKGTVNKTAKHYILQRQARRLAEDRRQIRFQFLSILAHELKAPLAAVEGYLNILKERSAGTDIASYDTAINRSLIRLEGMKKLIFDLLDLTRIESGQKKRTMSDVDLSRVAQTSIETHAALAAEKQVSIRYDNVQPVVINADPGEMEIILNNMISNAIKYNRTGGTVDITVRDGGRDVFVSVKDTGIGMSREEVGRLFTEFTRIKNEKTRNILGSGLGLSILRRLARLYGGDVTVESEPDKGTTFSVTLLKDYTPAEPVTQPSAGPVV